MLAEKETPAVGRLPVDVHEIRGVEHIAFIEDLLVEPLADPVIEFRGDMSEELEIEMLADDLAVVFPFGEILVKGSPHVEVQAVHNLLGAEPGPPKKPHQGQ